MRYDNINLRAFFRSFPKIPFRMPTPFFTVTFPKIQLGLSAHVATEIGLFAFTTFHPDFSGVNYGNK